MRRSRAVATSGLAGLMALDTTNTSAVAAFSARWPTKISAPKDSRRSVTGEALRSEPDTS
ncbi:hypothetical protein D3C76_1366650 [compost metagenome]